MYTPEAPGSNPTSKDLLTRDFPEMVVVDVTNVCNLSCIHCEQPNLRVRPGYSKNNLSLDLFKKVADECATHPRTVIRLVGDGEPLVNPNIVNMIEYTKDKGIKPIGITTAGFHLTGETTDRLLRAGIDYIDFSLDAYSKETYEKIRVGSSYHQVMANVHNFLRRREIIQNKNYTGDRTKVLVNMIDQSLSHAEVDDFATYWRPLVDSVFIRPLHSVVNLVEVSNPALEQAVERWPCRYLWERLEVTSDGKVSHCSQAWGRKSAIVGDISQQTIAEIWQGSVMEQLRANHLAREFPEGALCGPCRDWKTISWSPSQRFGTRILSLNQKASAGKP